MVIAAGSYPAGRWFESDRRYQTTFACRTQTKVRPHGLMVRTPPFHGGNRGSNPLGVTKQVKGEPVSIRRRIRLYSLLKVEIKNVQYQSQATSCSLSFFC